MNENLERHCGPRKQAALTVLHKDRVGYLCADRVPWRKPRLHRGQAPARAPRRLLRAPQLWPLQPSLKELCIKKQKHTKRKQTGSCEKAKSRYPPTQLNGGKIETHPGILCFPLKSEPVLLSLFPGPLSLPPVLPTTYKIPADYKYISCETAQLQ